MLNIKAAWKIVNEDMLLPSPAGAVPIALDMKYIQEQAMAAVRTYFAPVRAVWALFTPK